jgi:hypothetical protein
MHLHQAHSTFLNFSDKLARFANSSIFAGVGASLKPGAAPGGNSAQDFSGTRFGIGANNLTRRRKS